MTASPDQAPTTAPVAAPDLDVAALRSHFPQLADGTVYLDGPGGTQTPDVVADAIRDALLSPLSNRGTTTAAARNADAIVADARSALGDLLGTPAGTVAFGRSATQLTFDLARTLAHDWGPGDEVVVTRLDHDANIRPWLAAAAAVGASVRWVPFSTGTGTGTGGTGGTGELRTEDVAAAVGPRTRLVAVTGASNLLGTRPDLPAIAAVAHEAGAFVHVDGVHLTAHAPVDVLACGADTFVCSPYKFLGPHLGVLTGRAELLQGLRPDKLGPSSDDVPERFELGTLPYELLAGTTAAVDLLASLAPQDATAPKDATGRRARLVSAMTAVERHEDLLRARLEVSLLDLGATVLSRAPHRTPTLLCTFQGRRPAEVSHALAAAGVNAPAGHFYALEASRWLGLGEEGGVRIGLSPYTDDADLDRLLSVLADVLA